AGSGPRRVERWGGWGGVNRAEAPPPAPSVAATAGEAAPATPVRALFGLAHVELPALDVAAVQGRDGLLGLDVRGHFDEPEAARAPGVAVGDDRRGLTRPHLGKQRLQVRTRRLKGQIPYEQLLPHDLAPSPPLPGKDESRRNCKSEKPTARTTQRSCAPTKGLGSPTSNWSPPPAAAGAGFRVGPTGRDGATAARLCGLPPGTPRHGAPRGSSTNGQIGIAAPRG